MNDAPRAVDVTGTTNWRTDYLDLIYAVLKAVDALDGAAQAGEITAKVKRSDRPLPPLIIV